MGKIKTILTILLISITLSGCTSQVNNTTSLSNNKKISIDDKSNKNDILQNTQVSRQVIETLTSNEFEGRLVGTTGNDKCVNYITEIFENIGLEPFKNNFHHTYIQDPPEIFGENTIEQDKTMTNVIGKITGKDHTKAIFISAHLDHIGKKNNTIIRGAIDNASGIATLIQCASLLKQHSNNNQFEYDLIFCAFNGEEEGSQGSRSFVNDIKNTYKSSININIDSVGYIHGGDIIFLDRKDGYKDLYCSLEKSLNNNGINVSTNKIKGFSDNKSFDKLDIPNVCLVEENIKEVIHTSKDIPELIDYDRIDSIIKSIVEFIINSGYKLLN